MTSVSDSKFGRLTVQTKCVKFECENVRSNVSHMKGNMFVSCGRAFRTVRRCKTTKNQGILFIKVIKLASFPLLKIITNRVIPSKQRPRGVNTCISFFPAAPLTHPTSQLAHKSRQATGNAPLLANQTAGKKRKVNANSEIRS